ncbi:hypothetical protein PG996_006965 [Apiospora saccharicola]|uniref:RanBP2-type domain-containing protein n=1 Tax=Apiospora saccharicola TaxID=335842 RepID=A0ABR1V9L5_9PEZI
MGDHKHKSSSSRRHDGTKHDGDVHIGHSSSSKKEKKSSSKNLRWNCSQCGDGNNSLKFDAACPFCQSYRGPYDEVFDPNGEYRTGQPTTLGYNLTNT